MKIATRFIEAAKKEGVNPQFRQMVFDSVRRHKEKKKKDEKRKKRRWWLWWLWLRRIKR